MCSSSLWLRPLFHSLEVSSMSHSLQDSCHQSRALGMGKSQQCIVRVLESQALIPRRAATDQGAEPWLERMSWFLGSHLSKFGDHLTFWSPGPSWLVLLLFCGLRLKVLFLYSMTMFQDTDQIPLEGLCSTWESGSLGEVSCLPDWSGTSGCPPCAFSLRPE